MAAPQSAGLSSALFCYSIAGRVTLLRSDMTGSLSSRVATLNDVVYQTANGAAVNLTETSKDMFSCKTVFDTIKADYADMPYVAGSAAASGRK
jgi:hypothetical protein